MKYSVAQFHLFGRASTISALSLVFLCLLPSVSASHPLTQVDQSTRLPVALAAVAANHALLSTTNPITIADPTTTTNPIGAEFIHWDTSREHYTQAPQRLIRLQLYNTPIGTANGAGWHFSDPTLVSHSQNDPVGPTSLPFDVRIARLSADPILANIRAENGITLGVGLASIDAVAPGAVGGEMATNAVTYTAPVSVSHSDLSFHATVSGLDAQITIHDPNETGPFVFNLSPDPRTITVQVPGGVIKTTQAITTYGDSGTPYVITQTEYILEAPSATDSSGDVTSLVRSGPTTMSLSSTSGTQQQVSLGIDPTWLHAAGRIFPVRLTLPIVTADAATDTGLLGTVNSCTPDASAARDVIVGVQGGCTYHGLLRFDLSSLRSDTSILSTTLRLYTPDLATPSGLTIYPNAPLSDALSHAAAYEPPTWNTAPEIAPGSTGLAPVATIGHFQVWDVTSLVRAWVRDGQTNGGFTLVGTGAPVYAASPQGVRPQPSAAILPVACSLLPAPPDPIISSCGVVPTPPTAPNPTVPNPNDLVPDPCNMSANPCSADPPVDPCSTAPQARPCDPLPVAPPLPCDTSDPGAVDGSMLGIDANVVSLPDSTALCPAALAPAMDMVYQDISSQPAAQNYFKDTSKFIYGLSGTFAANYGNCYGANYSVCAGAGDVTLSLDNAARTLGASYARVSVTLSCNSSSPGRAWWDSSDQTVGQSGGNDADPFNVGSIMDILGRISSQNPVSIIPIVDFVPNPGCTNYATAGSYAGQTQDFVRTMVQEGVYPPGRTIYFEIGNEEDNTPEQYADGTEQGYAQLFAAAAQSLQSTLSTLGYTSYYVLTGGMLQPTANVSSMCTLARSRVGQLVNIQEARDAITAAENALGQDGSHLGVAVHPYKYTTKNNGTDWRNYRNYGLYYKDSCLNMRDMLNKWTNTFPRKPVVMTEVNWSDQPSLATSNIGTPITDISGAEGAYLIDLFSYLKDQPSHWTDTASGSPLRVAWFRGVDADKPLGIYTGTGNEKMTRAPMCRKNNRVIGQISNDYYWLRNGACQ